jgi:hypothetical protein
MSEFKYHIGDLLCYHDGEVVYIINIKFDISQNANCYIVSSPEKQKQYILTEGHIDDLIYWNDIKHIKI